MSEKEKKKKRFDWNIFQKEETECRRNYQRGDIRDLKI